MIRIKKIKSILKIEDYDMNDFFKACPYTLKELQGTSRHSSILVYRHLGIIWMRLSGYTLKETAKYFKVDHSNVCHIEVQLLKEFESTSVKNYFYDSVLKHIINISGYGHDDSNADISEKELGILIQMENFLNSNINRIHAKFSKRFRS